MENKVKIILQKARDLLAQPGKWSTGAFARNKRGAEVSVYSPEADNFCAIGAIRYVADQENSRQCATEARKVLSRAIGGRGIMGWNDSTVRYDPSTNRYVKRPKKEILEGFDKAIELAEKGGINEQDA